MPFDYTKPFRQKNGRAARNPRPNGHPIYPWRVDVLSHGNYWTVADFNDSGKFHNAYDDDRDLINIETQEEAMKDFDPKKPVQQRCGLGARIRLTDAAGIAPIVAEVELHDGTWNTVKRGADGRLSNFREYPSDLVNVPETQEAIANVYRDASGTLYAHCHENKAEADKQAKNGRVGRHPVTIRAEFVE